MAGKIPDDTLQEVRQRVSIVEVVSGYVSLKKAGRNHVGLCPFHAEKTPSFTVNEERGLFHCFGCGAGGTVFTFLMRADHIDFREAVEVLARRAGVTLPKRTEPGIAGEQIDRLVRLNELAQRCFRDALQSPQGSVAREYLEKRGVSPAAVERYGLGFCPANGSGLVKALAPKPVAIQKAVEIGLLGRRPNGTPYDRFWGRVTFPIRDGSGQIRGFGGRTLGNEHPKYLNSPESVLFHKERILYGLFEARQAVRDAGRLVIVEGYLDALALVDAGIGYVAASMGTALGAEREHSKSDHDSAKENGRTIERKLFAGQLNAARRFAREVVVFFDGDRAGEDAAVRAFGLCIEADVWGLGAILPKGFDPDSFVRTHGTAATLSLLKQAVPLWEIFVRRHNPGPDATVPQRVRAAQEIKAVIDKMRDRDPAQYGALMTQAAQRLAIDEASFRQIRTVSTLQRGVPAVDKVEPPAAFRPEEATLLEAMALDREVAVLVSHRGVLDAFTSTTLADAGRALIAAWERDHTGNGIIDQLPPAIAERVTAGLLGEGPIATGDRLQAAQDCIGRIERRARRSEAREMSATLRQAEAAGDDRRYREALARKNEFLRHKGTGNG
jgi:DNA primase